MINPNQRASQDHEEAMEVDTPTIQTLLQRTRITSQDGYKQLRIPHATTALSSRTSSSLRSHGEVASSESARESPERSSSLAIQKQRRPGKQRRATGPGKCVSDYKNSRSIAASMSPPRPPLEKRIRSMLGGSLLADRPVPLYDRWYHRCNISSDTKACT